MFKIFNTKSKQTVAFGLSLNEARYFIKTGGRHLIFLPV